MPNPNSTRSRMKNRGRNAGIQAGGDRKVITNMVVSQIPNTMFTNIPWRDPSVPRLRAFSAPQYWALPPAYKLDMPTQH